MDGGFGSPDVDTLDYFVSLTHLKRPQNTPTYSLPLRVDRCCPTLAFLVSGFVLPWVGEAIHHFSASSQPQDPRRRKAISYTATAAESRLEKEGGSRHTRLALPLGDRLPLAIGGANGAAPFPLGGSRGSRGSEREPLESAPAAP